MRSLPRKRLQHDTSIVGDASARYSVHSVSAAPITQADHCLSEALRLAERGYALTPVTLTRLPSGKKGSEFHARVRIGGKTLGWRHEAAWSSDPDQIRAWWVDHPDTSFAIGGAANAIEGVDLDVKAHADGVSWWSAQGLPLAPLVQHTPSGGVHLIWRVGEGQGLPQRVDGLTGVDTRNRSGLFYAAGAYILGEEGHYTIAGELPHLEALDVTPYQVVGLFADLGKRERPADGRIVEHDLEWQQAQVKKALESVRSFDRELDTEYRKRLQHLGLMYGRIVEQGITDTETAERQWRKAHCAVWGTEVWPENVKDFRDALRDGPALERWRTKEAAEEEAVTDRSSWLPVDLGPYLRGEIEPAQPSVGLQREDGVRLLYPGKEHSVIGEMESGKSWFSLACVAAELVEERPVLYIHFEEGDPGDTVTRLLLLGVTPQRILSHFSFIGPETPITRDVVDALTAARPSLVVLDGQNEAMALHGQEIREEGGAAAYRRVLVKPFTAIGAAVLSCDHVVKDSERGGQGYALGSIHKGNGLSGSLYLLENVEPFGIGRRGASKVSVTKDRPAQVRQHGKPTKVPRKFFLGMLTVDATSAGRVDLRFWPPSDEGNADHPFSLVEKWHDVITDPDRQLPDDVMKLMGKGRDAARDIYRVLSYVGDPDGLTTSQVRDAVGEGPRQYEKSTFFAGQALLVKAGICEKPDRSRITLTAGHLSS